MTLRERRPWNLQEFQRELLRIGGDNLVAYWPLDDKSGTTARDIGPNAEVLDITGTTLGQNGPPQLGRSHYFDGINDVDSQHVYEDETGASWGPTVHGLSLADGVAFARVQGVDLSPFAGTEGSDTPYMLVLTDDAGSKVSWGYIGAQEAAEELGSELYATANAASDPNGNEADAITGWISNYDTFESTGADKSTGSYSLHAVRSSIGNDAAGYVCSFTKGKLYKAILDVKVVSGNPNIRAVDGNGSWLVVLEANVADAVWTSKTYYFTAKTTGTDGGVGFSETSNFEAYLDNISIKEVTHVGTDGVHIVSTKDGSTRNWAGIDGSFDYNDSAYTFEVRSTLFQQTGALTVGAWVKPAAASLAESEYFIAKRASADLSWALYRNTSEQYSTFVSLSGASTASSIVGTPHVDTDWRFVMFTFEPSVALILYVNGSAEASDTIGIPASLFDSSAPLTVGDYSELVRTWQGNIAHAFVISAALDSRSIRRLYEIGSRAHSG